MEDKKTITKTIGFMNYRNHHFIINNIINLGLIIKLLIEQAVFIKNVTYKLKNVKFINFY